MRTITIMTATVPGGGTYALSSKVDESAESALRHVEAMSAAHDTPPAYVTTSGMSWRWTWEYMTEDGRRCTDTVRLIP